MQLNILSKSINFRTLHTCSILRSLQKSPLYELRQKTGLAYNLCREALNKHENNVREAESWLQAQALAHGLQKATKLGNRNAREGVIGLAVREDKKLITLLELNCETDFVAKNQNFKDLALDLTEQVASIRSNCDSLQIPDQNSVEQLRPTKEQLKDMENLIVPLITKLGENIKLQRAIHYQVSEEDTFLFGQIHSQAGKKAVSGADITIGRFGAIAALRAIGRDGKSVTSIGNRICQHVIGFSPTYIELPEDIRKHLEAAEKQEEVEAKAIENDHQIEEAEEQDSDSEADQLTTSNRDDWPSIMDQQLIMSDGQTVRDFCKDNNVSIVYFNRFECGQSS